MRSEPEWSKATSKSGYLEVLKEGKIIEKIIIDVGSKFVSFGRLIDNTVSLQHDSISRKHAVLWFGPNNSAFLFDLNSTHGTFLNKKILPSQKYVKINCGNDLIQFGASSRFFMLNLEEDATEQVINEKSARKESRSAVLNFFSSHKISKKKISINNTGKIFVCSIDFSEFISINNFSGTLVISSSGSTKEQALKNFFEDSFNLLLRLGLIDNLNEYSCSEFVSSEDEFYVEKNLNKSFLLKDAIPESQVIIIRNQCKNEIDSIKNEIEILKANLFTFESEAVHDFDVYVLQIKITEIKEDIDKRLKRLEISKKEFNKYDQILHLIECKVSSNEPTSLEDYEIIQTDPLMNSAKKIENTEKDRKLVNITLPICAKIDVECNFIDCEETACNGPNAVNLDDIKRKYGY